MDKDLPAHCPLKQMCSFKFTEWDSSRPVASIDLNKVSTAWRHQVEGGECQMNQFSHRQRDLPLRQHTHTQKFFLDGQRGRRGCQGFCGLMLNSLFQSFLASQWSSLKLSNCFPFLLLHAPLSWWSVLNHSLLVSTPLWLHRGLICLPKGSLFETTKRGITTY